MAAVTKVISANAVKKLGMTGNISPTGARLMQRDESTNPFVDDISITNLNSRYDDRLDDQNYYSN